MAVRMLITGASGFIGSALVGRMAAKGAAIPRAAVRTNASTLTAGVDYVSVGDLTDEVDWKSALAGVDAVIHLAARVHVMREQATDPMAQFRRVNVTASLNLARQAAAAGVRRFVFLSSLKVNGEAGSFTEDSRAAPEDAYGKSKHEAELGLSEIAAKTGLELVIVRPPLVYGPGVRANFKALMQAVARGIPLPLGAIDNRRSLVALDNLVDFILTCTEHPAAANELFFVSDGQDLSTTDLIRRLARAMRRPARLVPVPASIVLGAATLVGQRHAARRLVGSLQVDISKARRVLDWTPPVSVDEGIRRAVETA
jgi:nucleoside-diphosphate-sugar epimerase